MACMSGFLDLLCHLSLPPLLVTKEETGERQAFCGFWLMARTCIVTLGHKNRQGNPHRTFCFAETFLRKKAANQGPCILESTICQMYLPYNICDGELGPLDFLLLLLGYFSERFLLQAELCYFKWLQGFKMSLLIWSFYLSFYYTCL